MSVPAEEFDVVVLGAGRRGLAAALRVRAERPGARLLVVDERAWPGGSVRTLRSNGFVCELGPFAFAAAELAPLCALLARPPAVLAALPTAASGWHFTGGRLEPAAVEEPPCSFRTGNEELAQACRRELGAALRLGRAATAIEPADGFQIQLGGEVPTRIVTAHLVVALPERAAARLLGRFDPNLPALADRLATAPAAMVFLGGLQAEAPELRGYGILPGPDVASPVGEAIFCDQVFAGRALPGRCLVRLECDAAGTDADVLATAEAELRRWSGTRAAFAFGSVHPFAREVPDGARVECRSRLRALPARVPGLALALGG